MCKKGWHVGLGQEGVTLGLGKLSEILYRGWNRKEWWGNKDFKKGNKLGQGVGALKRVGGWNPITKSGKRIHNLRNCLNLCSLR